MEETYHEKKCIGDSTGRHHRICLITGCGAASSGTARSSAPQQTQESAPASDEAGTSTADAADLTGHTLMIYCGAGMTKPFQEIADSFKSATGCEMNVTYANAGQIQSQITTSEEGDMFIAGSAEELKPLSPMYPKAGSGKTYTRTGSTERQSEKHYLSVRPGRRGRVPHYRRCGLYSHWKDCQKGPERCRYP